MDAINYYESLKFDRQRIIKKNSSRVTNLKNIKVVGKYKEKKKYKYITLNERVKSEKDIIIVINNNILRIDNKISQLDERLNNYQDNIAFFKRNKFKKNYSKIKNQILFNVYTKIMKIYKYASSHNLLVKDIYLINYDKSIDNNYMIYELDNLLTVAFLPYEKRINYIYDYMCDYLDSEFMEFNLCDFKDEKCVSRRELECSGCKNPVTYGCCYTKGRVCPNLINSRCTIKSLPCKFFTCRYLERRGIKYRPWDYLLIRLFLSYRQMDILDMSLYTPKEEIMKKLLKKNIFDGIKKNVYNLSLILEFRRDKRV